MTQSTKCERRTYAASLQLIAAWEGNDPRWYHREGGEPFQGAYWIDKFTAANASLAIFTIANLADTFSLDSGSYQLIWDAHLVFGSTPCSFPSASYSAMSCTAIRHGSGSGSPFLGDAQIDQVYVCANRNGLTYELGLQLKFAVSGKQENVDFAFYAFNDDGTGRKGATNIKEVIVYKMELYKTG